MLSACEKSAYGGSRAVVARANAAVRQRRNGWQAGRAARVMCHASKVVRKAQRAYGGVCRLLLNG